MCPHILLLYTNDVRISCRIIDARCAVTPYTLHCTKMNKMRETASVAHRYFCVCIYTYICIYLDINTHILCIHMYIYKGSASMPCMNSYKCLFYKVCVCCLHACECTYLQKDSVHLGTYICMCVCEIIHTLLEDLFQGLIN